MVNESKLKDPRAWEKWKISGAVSSCVLPGAERFYKYLIETYKQPVKLEGPEVVDLSYNGAYALRWGVKIGHHRIGEYFTFGPKPGEVDFAREFKGRLPGYVNECIQLGNRYSERKLPEDLVTLVFSNKRFEHQYEEHFKGWHFKCSGIIVETPWQRQDGHNNIVFP